MIKAITISLLLITWQGNTILAQKLNPGDFAPQFEVLDVFGKKVQISNDNDSKIFIAFMRYVGCPVCNFRTHELIESYQKLKALGYKLLVVYESEPETIKKYLQESPVPFQVIADPKRKLYKKYKVQPSFWHTFNSAFNKKPILIKRKVANYLVLKKSNVMVS